MAYPVPTSTAPRNLSAGAAATLADLIPILTCDGSTASKLVEVARRLSIRGAYETVDFILLEGDRLRGLRHHLIGGGLEPLAGGGRWEQSVQRREAFSAFSDLERGQAAVIYDRLQYDRRLTANERELARLYGLGSVLVVPLVWDGVLRGALAVSSKQEAAFRESDGEDLATLAGQISALIKGQRLVEELASANERISRLQDDTVMMLANTAEAHDEATGVHLRAMRSVTEMLAGELGFAEEEAIALGQAAVLHDLGKVRINSRLLTKPGRLTPQELLVLRQHPIWGEQLLAGRPGFEVAARVARWHHERWDGGGYPDGLRGEQIPLEVAIVTVADSYDAIVTSRSYQRPRTSNWALQEIQRCSGEQFNARVVDAFTRLHERGLIPHPHSEGASESQACADNGTPTMSGGRSTEHNRGN